MHKRHDYYNRDNFPTVVVNHGKWDILQIAENHCAAIPTDAPGTEGCRASHFGDLEYVRCTLGDILPDQWKGQLIRHNVKR